MIQETVQENFVFLSTCLKSVVFLLIKKSPQADFSHSNPTERREIAKGGPEKRKKGKPRHPVFFARGGKSVVSGNGAMKIRGVQSWKGASRAPVLIDRRLTG